MAKKATPVPFEKSLKELEELVEQLEKGDIPLEESLISFERGIQLTRACQKALKEAEQKVEILLQDNLIEWVVTEDIPAEYSHVIVSMLAAECVAEFYVPPDLRTGIVAEGKYDLSPQLGGPSVAERRLRKLAAPGFNGEPAQPDYF